MLQSPTQRRRRFSFFSSRLFVVCVVENNVGFLNVSPSPPPERVGRLFAPRVVRVRPLLRLWLHRHCRHTPGVGGEQLNLPLRLRRVARLLPNVGTHSLPGITRLVTWTIPVVAWPIPAVTWTILAVINCCSLPYVLRGLKPPPGAAVDRLHETYRLPSIEPCFDAQQ
jgi:hypothetical protein